MSSQYSRTASNGTAASPFSKVWQRRASAPSIRSIMSRRRKPSWRTEKARDIQSVERRRRAPTHLLGSTDASSDYFFMSFRVLASLAGSRRSLGLAVGVRPRAFTRTPAFLRSDVSRAGSRPSDFRAGFAFVDRSGVFGSFMISVLHRPRDPLQMLRRCPSSTKRLSPRRVVLQKPLRCCRGG